MSAFGRLGRNTLKASFGLYLRTGLQTAVFILIARALGPSGYGAFAAVMALTAVFAPFSGCGHDAILVRDVARDHKRFRESWGRSLFMVAVSGLPLVIVVVILGWGILPSSISLWVVAAIALSDLVFARILEMAARAFQAFEWMGRAVVLRVFLSALRLVGVAVMIWVCNTPDVGVWSVFYVAASAIACVVSVLYVNSSIAKPVLRLGGIRASIGEGVFFSISGGAEKINTDIDKAMLARLASLDVAGIYSAAYRIVDVVFTPIGALLASAYAKFFQHGSEGIASNLAYALRILPIPILYAVIGSVTLYVMAPLVIVILGESFSDAIYAIQWLSVLPLLMVGRHFPSMILGGAGFQKERSLCQIGAALTNIFLNLWLIPLYGWYGAVWATLATEVLLGVMLWLLIWRMLSMHKT